MTSRKKRAAEPSTEVLFRAVVEGIEDYAIFMLDPEGRVASWNAGAERIKGYRREEIVGKHFSVFYPDSVVAAGWPAHELEEARKTGHFENEGWRRRKDGSEFWANVVITALHDADGHLVGFSKITRDLTERRRHEDEMRHTEKLATMGQLLAGVAHELNNPLAIMMAQSDMLGRQLKDQPKLAQRASKISDAAERCARIVRNFLALARQRPADRHKIVLNDVVKEAVELVVYPLRADGIQLTLDLADDAPALWADPFQIQQVLVNLVTNAHHALRTGPPPHSIVVSTRKTAEGAVLRVSDDGPGVPPAARAMIFEPFFTTKEPGKGTGLGLSLCQGIAESHGGKMWLDETHAPGASFVVELPRGSQTWPEAVAPAAEAATLPSLSILVVDDEPILLEVLADFLEYEGHHVETAPDGIEALKKLETANFDVVLTDLRMPRLDGQTLYRRIQERWPEHVKRVVFLSGDALTPESVKFLDEVGAVRVTKPFRPADIIAALHAVRDQT